jgi:hypothetical protein
LTSFTTGANYDIVCALLEVRRSVFIKTTATTTADQSATATPHYKDVCFSCGVKSNRTVGFEYIDNRVALGKRKWRTSRRTHASPG